MVESLDDGRCVHQNVERIERRLAVHPSLLPLLPLSWLTGAVCTIRTPTHTPERSLELKTV